jgi:IS30 family transposase
MAQGYRQLTYEDRVQAYLLWRIGYSQSAIARALGVSRSTISREFSWLKLTDRNRDSHDLAREAHARVSLRTSVGRSACRIINGPVWNIVQSKLVDEKWAPEQIANWLDRELPEHALSHQTIYNYIYDNQPEWIQHLRRKGKRPRVGRKSRKHKIIEGAPPKTPISERPEIFGNRERFGDWEVDLVGSLSRSTILILLERKARFSILLRVPNKLSETIRDAICNALSAIPPELRRSLTYDNGPENARFFELNENLKTSSFFCAPYHSWEKGSVENRIGVIRIFFPKGTNFDHVTEQQIAHTQYLLNHRPMKLLDNQFPASVFNNEWLDVLKKKAA